MGSVSRSAASRRALTNPEQVLDEHAERGARVTDVVLPDHVMAERLERAGERVTHDGHAQVPTRTPWLRWAAGNRERVDGYLLCLPQRYAQPVVGKMVLHLGRDPTVDQRHVDEVGTADFQPSDDIVSV